MPEGLDVELLRRRLEGRFQLPLSRRQEVIDGGQFDVLRPSQFEVGNGFGIVISRTRSLVEASFKAENFAGALLRTMSESDADARALFARVRAAASAAGATVFVAVNENPAELLDEEAGPWKKLEIDVTQRLPSFRKHSFEALEPALVVSSACLSLALSLLPMETSSADNAATVAGLPEGARMRVEVNRYERSPVNRASCLSHFGLVCQCCGFDFAGFYGQLGDGYIEVHHRVPVSRMGAGYVVDPVLDLVPLCGNCHAMVHRTDPPMPVEELTRLIEGRQQLG
jgi:5-methylcytosine-specific restriction protein A